MRLFQSSLIVSLLATRLAFSADAPARTEADILNSIKLPAGYEATVFAMPPDLGYPTSVSAAPDGVLFVAVDENGSIDRSADAGACCDAWIPMATGRRIASPFSRRWTVRAA